MSLQGPVGPESNLLDITPQHCARMMVEMPILSLEEMQALKDSSYRYMFNFSNTYPCIGLLVKHMDMYCRGWTTRVIDCTMAASGSAQDMVDSLFNICEEATEAVQGAFRADGVKAIILSDKLTGYSGFESSLGIYNE